MTHRTMKHMYVVFGIPGLLIISILFAIILLLGCCIGKAYNVAVNSEEHVQETHSNVDVSLTTRFNKLNELAQCVKQYDEHEYRVIHETIAARGKNMSKEDAKQCMIDIAAVAEQYPQLQSQKNYEILMKETSAMENTIAQSRNSYNNALRSYKTLCKSFPHNIILDIFNYDKKDFSYYEAIPSVNDNNPLELFK